ncbi:MAG: sulfatase-like hydrolase/transferase [Opitutaceae bacterium]
MTNSLKTIAMAAALFAAVSVAAAERPSVIVIVSDNQAYFDIGAFGSKEAVTPNLDRMAAEGVMATNFYVTSPACTPSRGSILTGRYPQRNGLYEMIRNELVRYGHRYTPEEYAYSPEMTLGMDPREVNLGEMMKSACYATAAIGKWDSGRAKRYLPTRNGYDYWYGFACTGTDYWTHDRYGIPSMFRNEELVEDEGFSEELFTHEALNFIRKNSDNPFLLYLAYHAPAGNADLDDKRIYPPQKYLDLYPGMDPAKRRTEYLATISCMDDGIGQIMALLKELRIDDNTLVVFFPDNGAGAPGDRGIFNLGGGQIDRLGEAGIRVNFIARWPGVIPAGTTSDALLSSLDVFPTLVAISGAEISDSVVLDGFNMLPVLQGRTKSLRTEMFWKSRHSRAARVGKYKWIVTPELNGLFDLSVDPGETNDLSESKPEILALVRSRWENWDREMKEAEPRGPFRNY